nr:MAG TPA: hypothetical protein [Caudoviricetes sp.]
MMKNLITRYPRTTGYTLIAALQLTVFSQLSWQTS